MHESASRPGSPGPASHRRAWLAGVLGGLAAARLRADDAPDDLTAEARAAAERGRELGLRPFRTVRSEHYLATGNAPEDYLRIVLHDCEAVARDFLGHYAAKGFPVAFPATRMTTVVLEDERAFARFFPDERARRNERGGFIAGLYLRTENYLVLQDFRRVPRSRADLPAWADNLRVLAHEATHQLTYHTGLLDRLGDLPSCIAEGLATYGEQRRPGVPSPPGQVNRNRLSDLAHFQRWIGWTPVAQLLDVVSAVVEPSGDAARDSARNQLFYAQSWLLVYHLMTGVDRTLRFRNYLEAIRSRRDPGHRRDDALAHLGDLDALDRDLKRESVRLLRAG
jgi:hypothetical protein